MAILTASCLEKYEPPTMQGNFGFLVVEGFLNADGSVKVNLSRTNSLSDKSKPPYETGAIVVLEQRNVRNFNLQDIGQGTHVLMGIALSSASEYRLRIKAKGRDYMSDYVKILPTPPIDEISWEPQADGIQLFVSAHDPSAQSRFYQWNYTETWQHDTYYVARYRVTDGIINMLTNDQLVNRCWATENSTRILVHSTSKLSQDVVNKFPLTFIPRESLKISSVGGIYSILVRQLVITEKTYNFWSELQKSTESIGGLFDPLPSQVVGNMHGPANLTDPVLGFFSAGQIAEKRIYINPLNFPEYLRVNRAGECPLFPLVPAEGQSFQDLLNSLNNQLLVTSSPLNISFSHCLDCRVQGGTTTKPDFWP